MQISEELVRELLEAYDDGVYNSSSADLVNRVKLALAAPSPLHISELYEAAKQIDPRIYKVEEFRVEEEDADEVGHAMVQYRSLSKPYRQCLGDSPEALLADIRESLAEMVSSR